MDKYKNVHKWMILVFAVVILGFMNSYWLKFTKVSWDNHLHSITATGWYIFVVIQPYLIVKKKLKRHRYLGMLGLILAGGVAISALNAIDGNIEGALAGGGKIATASFLYGVSLIDFLSVAGFIFSIVMAITKVKNVDDHAMWMISTVLWAFMPAFGRLVLLIMFTAGIIGDNSFIEVLILSTPIIFIIIAIISIRMKRLHPAMLLVGIAHIFYFFIGPIGDSPAWRSIAEAVFK